MSKLSHGLAHYLHIVFMHTITQLMILLLALFVLFSGDLEVVVIPHEYHNIVIMIRNFCFGFFFVEFFLAIIIEEGYCFSIYFLMDFIDLVSLATEVSYIWGPFLKLLDNLQL